MATISESVWCGPRLTSRNRNFAKPGAHCRRYGRRTAV